MIKVWKHNNYNYKKILTILIIEFIKVKNKQLYKNINGITNCTYATMYNSYNGNKIILSMILNHQIHFF